MLEQLIEKPQLHHIDWKYCPKLRKYKGEFIEPEWKGVVEFYQKWEDSRVCLYYAMPKGKAHVFLGGFGSEEEMTEKCYEVRKEWERSANIRERLQRFVSNAQLEYGPVYWKETLPKRQWKGFTEYQIFIIDKARGGYHLSQIGHTHKECYLPRAAVKGLEAARQACELALISYGISRKGPEILTTQQREITQYAPYFGLSHYTEHEANKLIDFLKQRGLKPHSSKASYFIPNKTSLNSQSSTPQLTFYKGQS